MTIHLSETLQERNEVLFGRLVPFSGKCETAEGETLRAVNKIVYRYYNDGDKFFEGYGCETAGPAHAYLFEVSPLQREVAPIIDRMDGADDQGYEQGLVELTDTVVTHIEGLLDSGHHLTPNDFDMLDCESRYEDEEDDGCPWY
jgi:hypothetical protein